MGQEEFYLDEDKVERGVRLPLYDRNDKPTKHFLVIRSSYSDAYQKAYADALRRARAIKPGDEISESELTRETWAALVADWSFDEPCTRENVLDFLKKARHLGRRIAAVADNTRLFFMDSEESSSHGPKRKSS